MNLPPRLWTIGHSTHGIEAFTGMLRAHGIETLADVRLLPGSTRYPHFNSDALLPCLRREGIDYVAFPELGGRRRPLRESHNLVWRNASFRGYADYMETDDFQKAIDRLNELAGRSRTALMCAEALWWKCHRSLIADYEKARGVEVLHILSENKVEPHPYTSAARIIDGRLSYEAAPPGNAGAKEPEFWPV